MRSERLNWNSCRGTSTTAIKASEAHSQTNDPAQQAGAAADRRARRHAAEGEHVRKQPADDPRAHAAHHHELEQRLAELGSAVQAEQPLQVRTAELMREKSGTNAAGLKFHPPSTTVEQQYEADQSGKYRQRGRIAQSRRPRRARTSSIAGPRNRSGSIAMPLAHQLRHSAGERGSHRNERDAAADHGREIGQLPGARHLAALARLLQASLRRLFGAFAACALTRPSARSRGGRADQFGDGPQGAVDEARDADHEPVEPDGQHEEARHQRDGESDAEQIELRRRARDDAERQIHDDQRDDGRQCDQQSRFEDPRAPGGDRQQEISVDVRAADRQGSESCSPGRRAARRWPLTAR